MPWQPFRRKNKYRQVDETEMETSFDSQLPRSASDGNLVRAPSEVLLLSNFDPRKSYGTCSGGAGSFPWAGWVEHEVEEGETLAGLALRYNITIQDIKLANKIWTNEGLWPGRGLRIPTAEPGTRSLDLSGSSAASETVSTDSGSGLSALSGLAGPSASSSSGLPGSPTSLPLRLPRVRPEPGPPPGLHRASVEDLSSFLSNLDTSIAVNKQASSALIKSSAIKEAGREGRGRARDNNNSEDGVGSGHQEVGVAGRGYQDSGYSSSNIC